MKKAERQLDRRLAIRVDGGICSQIAFVAFGLELAKRGFSVQYDLEWFEKCGADMDGRFARNWDFPRAFPGINVPLMDADRRELPVLYCDERTSLGDVRSPAYVGGYPARDEAIDLQIGYLRECFAPVLDDVSRDYLRRIRRGPACAIHVRRGDLAKAGELSGCYGPVCADSYFERAMLIVEALRPGSEFYFFSDEPQWVRDCLVKNLPFAERTTILDANGSDRGYLDLFLMSRCQGIVASRGSFGSFAALLSMERPLLVIPNGKGRLSERLPNVVYLNEDYLPALRKSATDSNGEAGGAFEDRSQERETCGTWRRFFAGFRRKGGCDVRLA